MMPALKLIGPLIFDHWQPGRSDSASQKDPFHRIVSVNVRVLGAVSLGGAGHLNPLVPFLQAARRAGDEVLVVGPPAMADLVAASSFPFVSGRSPTRSM